MAGAGPGWPAMLGNPGKPTSIRVRSPSSGSSGGPMVPKELERKNCGCQRGHHFAKTEVVNVGLVKQHLNTFIFKLKENKGTIGSIL